jgi:6-phosphofructokinase 2
VSLGEKGALLTTPDNSFFCSAPHINTSSTVGAGDSMVAGLAYAFAQNKKPSDTLKLATACGTGTAKQPGTQLFSTDDLDSLLKVITVKTLDI